MNYFFENTHFCYSNSSWAVLINFNNPFTPLITSIYTGQGFKAFLSIFGQWAQEAIENFDLCRI